jgi:hypothetical protein
MGKLIAAAGLLTVVAAVVGKQAPELRRYMKIRSM